jgi:hypothetical protein
MEIQDFAKEYTTKSNEELLRLALDTTQLTIEANFALSAELRNRGLDTKDQIHNFRQLEYERKQKEELDIGRLWLLHPYGIGRKRFCEGRYSFDSASGIEEFTTTIFVILLWLPLIPTGTYRVRREKGVRPIQINAIQRLPLDWGQVAKVWLLMLLSVLLLIWAGKFL